MEEQSTSLAEERSSNTVTGMILGLIGLAGWFLPVLGLPTAIMGLVWSVKGLRSAQRGMAYVAIALNVLACVGALASAAYLGNHQA